VINLSRLQQQELREAGGLDQLEATSGKKRRLLAEANTNTEPGDGRTDRRFDMPCSML
jgi:hypothetical protein